MRRRCHRIVKSSRRPEKTEFGTHWAASQAHWMFVGGYNDQWLVEENGFLSPNQARKQRNAVLSVRPAA